MRLHFAMPIMRWDIDEISWNICQLDSLAADVLGMLRKPIDALPPNSHVPGGDERRQKLPRWRAKAESEKEAYFNQISSASVR